MLKMQGELMSSAYPLTLASDSYKLGGYCKELDDVAY